MRQMLRTARALGIGALLSLNLGVLPAFAQNAEGAGTSALGNKQKFEDFINRLQKQNKKEIDQRFDLCTDNPFLPQCHLLGQRIDPCGLNPELPQCQALREYRG